MTVTEVVGTGNECRLGAKRSREFPVLLAAWSLQLPALLWIALSMWDRVLPYYTTVPPRPSAITLFYLQSPASSPVPYLVGWTVLLALLLAKQRPWSLVLSATIIVLSFTGLCGLILAAEAPLRDDFVVSPGAFVHGGRRAASPPVVDGNVLLLRKGQVFGALVIHGQESDGSFRYQWFLTTKGEGGTGLTFAGASTGSGARDVSDSPLTEIVFGPFRLDYEPFWRGLGRAYYSCPPGVSARTDTGDMQRLCVTEETDASQIDPRAPVWRYRLSVLDPGVAGDL